MCATVTGLTLEEYRQTVAVFVPDIRGWVGVGGLRAAPGQLDLTQLYEEAIELSILNVAYLSGGGRALRQCK